MMRVVGVSLVLAPAFGFWSPGAPRRLSVGMLSAAGDDDVPAWAEVDGVAPAPEAIPISKPWWDFTGDKDEPGSAAASELRREAETIQEVVDQAATACAREIRSLESTKRETTRALEAAARRADAAKKDTERYREEARAARGAANAEAVAAARAAVVAEADEAEKLEQARAAASKERALAIASSRTDTVAKAVAANAEDLEAAVLDRDRAVAERAAAEERRKVAVAQTFEKYDASVARVEADIARAVGGLGPAKPEVEPVAAVVAGGFCGMFFFDWLHLDALGAFGFILGAGAMTVKLPSSPESATGP